MSAVGRPRRDPNEVATIVRQAIAAGETRPARAVARHYGTSLDTANHIIRQARRRGANVPTGGRGPKPGSSRERFAEIAAIACAAAKADQPIAAAVAKQHGVSYRTATSLISRARREHGFDIPFDLCLPGERDGIAERVDVETVPVKVGLQCACGHRTGLVVVEMIRHTMSEHGRPPTRQERTPDDGKQVAA